MAERGHEEGTDHDGWMERPKGCPRGRTDCEPLSRIASMDEDGEEYRTFICCGENDGTHPGPPQDKWRLCIKSEDGADVLLNVDGRDIVDISSVLTSGLSFLSIASVDEHGVPLNSDPTPPTEDDDGQ